MAAKPAPGPSTVLRSHRAEVQSLCCHPTQHILYSGDADGEVKVWGLSVARPVQSQRLHSSHAGITALLIYEKSAYILMSQGRDGSVKQWRLTAEGLLETEPMQTIQTGSYNFCRIAMHVVNTQPAVSQDQGIGNATTSTELAQKPAFTQAEAQRQAPTLHQDKYSCGVVAIPGYDPAVLAIWDLQLYDPADCDQLQLVFMVAVADGATEQKTGQCIDQLAQPPGVKHGMCMAVQLYTAADSHQLHALVGYEDGEVAVWNVPSGQILASKHFHQEPVMAVAVDAAATGGLCAAADNKLHRFWLTPGVKLLELCCTVEVKQQGIADLAIRQDQRIFASAGWDSKIRVFSYGKCKALAILQYHKKAVTALAFYQHDQRLYTASRDGNIAAWQIFETKSL